ncbi:hypothetical protein FRC01_014879 [Tulasnella sp. 417]|nr:hypothetical protein FRC01_014879 [Tulasnella sp. 417]
MATVMGSWSNTLSAQVLSGKEPYSDHDGIGSIIMGVLLSGERPPKEPVAALDGTSYLQLWDEASTCWDEDPAVRPSIVHVLARIDGEIAGNWITAQHIAVEASLHCSIHNGQMALSGPITSDSPLRAEVTDATQTLRWAESIRARVNGFINSKLPISRITPMLLGAIIWQDDTILERNFVNKSWSRGLLPFEKPICVKTEFSFERDRLNTAISRMLRSLQLREVSKAWCHAIDSSTQLWPLLYVDNERSNAKHIQRCNPEGSLEFVVAGMPPTSLLPTLGPLTPLTSRINIASLCPSLSELLNALAFPQLTQVYLLAERQRTEEVERSFINLNPFANSVTALRIHGGPPPAFGSAQFAVLKSLRIASINVPTTFISDFFAMLRTAQNLQELVLFAVSPENDLEEPPLSRITHRGLQRIRLSCIAPPILAALFLHLDAENVLLLDLLELQPEQLPGPDTAFFQTIRSLAAGSLYPQNNGSLDVCLNAHPQQDVNKVTVEWSAIGYVPESEPVISHWKEDWDSNVIRSATLSSKGAAEFFHKVLNFGLRLDWLSLRPFVHSCGDPPEIQSWLEALASLDFIRGMAIGTVLLEGIMKRLSEPISGTTDKAPRYLWPHLTELRVVNSWEDLKPDLSLFREHIDRRQQAAAENPVDGPAKITNIWFSDTLIDEVEEAGGFIVDGVEIYYSR